MSSMPILDPVPEPMETDLPSEEVIVCCVFVYVFYVIMLVCFDSYIVFIVVFRVKCVQIMMCFKMW